MSDSPARYRLRDSLGHGGMGRVVLAEDGQLGRMVAVKFLSETLEHDPKARERLVREARSAAALDHPYICKVHEIVTIDGRVGIVMEYVRGETLETRLRRATPTAVEALAIAGEIAEAMDAAHQRQVIHRDLKPSNVMLTDSGHVKVMDFGLAKALTPDGKQSSLMAAPLTETGHRPGTPRYMSPEQLLGAEVDTRSDIFAFGILVYELLAGVHPFHHGSSSETMAAILRDSPPPIARRRGLPPLAQELLDRLLAKEPAHRYQSFRDVRAAVEQLRRDATAMTPSASVWQTADSTCLTLSGPGTSRVASPTEERRQLTAIFCEIDGLGDLSNSLDAEDLLDLCEQYRSIWQGQIDRFGGTAGRYSEGALYGYFGYPIAHEHDARRALSCGLAIRSAIDSLVKRAGEAGISRPSVRIGINTGSAIVGQQHGDLQVHGNTASVAARLADYSAGGAVVASGTTCRIGGGHFECKPLGSQRLRGFSDPLPLYEVVAEKGARTTLGFADQANVPVLVGRGLELTTLRQRWTQARNGQGSVVLVSGEAGIGKSRLIDAFVRSIAADGQVWVESLYCSPLNSGSPLYPLVECLKRRLGQAVGQGPRDSLTELRSWLAESDAQSDEALFLLAELLRIELPSDVPRAGLAPAAQQAKTAQLLLQLLTHQRRGHPGLILVDDLHWADPTTLAWIELLVGQVPTQPLLVLVTARPPCHYAWLSRPRTSAMALGRLETDEILAICQGRCPGMSLPPEILQHIAEKTDGVPLFAEELTNMILESDILETEGNRYVLKGPMPTEVIPSTLQGSLMSRLDSLSRAKYVAEAGAVVGRRFSFQILQALTGEPEDVLSQHLQALVDAELLFQSGFVPESRYVFKHALIQDAAYNGMLRARRAELHERVAAALEAPETTDHPEVVAYHYARAGKATKAAELYRQAGRDAMARYANAEAIQHLEAGREQLRQLPEGNDRDVAELAILTLLGPARNMIKGYLDPEAEEILTRATELCRNVADPEPLVFALVGLSTTHMIRAHYQLALDAATRIGDVARVTGNSNYQVMSRTILSCVCLYTGAFAAAVEHAAAVGRLHDDTVASTRMALLGWGTLEVSRRVYGAWALSMLGYPARAVEQSAKATDLVGQSNYHFDIYHTQLYAATTLLSQRDFAGCQRIMSEYLPLGLAYGDPFPIAISTIVYKVSLRDPEDQNAGREAKAIMEELRQSGYGIGYSFLLGCVADAALHFGDIDAAAAAVREAFEHLDTTGPEIWEAEIHRLNGDVLLEQGQPKEVVATSYARALDIAERQHAKLLELRAATSLVRVLSGTDDEGPARQRLLSLYNWFTEGFAAADLVDARRVLDPPAVV